MIISSGFVMMSYLSDTRDTTKFSFSQYRGVQGLNDISRTLLEKIYRIQWRKDDNDSFWDLRHFVLYHIKKKTNQFNKSEMFPRLPINGYCFQLPIPLVETIMPHGTLQTVKDNVQSKGRKQIPKYNWNFSFSLMRWNIFNRNNLRREKIVSHWEYKFQFQNL